MQDPFNDLAQLTDALHQSALGKMKEVNAREARLRRNLTELEERRRNSLALPQTQINPVRQIGADVLWEGWISRTRADLNTQLAQVLAQKAHLTVELSRTFGKQMAAAKLLENAQYTKYQRHEKRRWQILDSLQLLAKYTT